jgi:hypothetical protein
MNHALRMNHYFNLVLPGIEQPTGFNNFEALVHHGGGVDRDFPAHYPLGMGAGFVRCD